jgi:hypothetical protein
MVVLGGGRFLMSEVPLCSSQSKNYLSTERFIGSEAGSYVGLMDSCITQRFVL